MKKPFPPMMNESKLLRKRSPEEQRAEVGHSLRGLRCYFGRSLRDVAESVGMRPVTLGEIERGVKADVSKELVRIIARECTRDDADGR